MDPHELTPRRAASRYLDNRRPEISEGTYSTYKYRLKLFVEWCELEGITQVGDLDGWTLDEYRAHRAGQNISPSTLHNELDTLSLFAAYLDRIGATDDLEESIEIPTVPKEARSREEKLEPERGESLIRFFRTSDNEFGSRSHALLEIAWHTAARMGAIRGLDLRDINQEENYLHFRHRPETGTPLKKKLDGGRFVGVDPAVMDAISAYIRTGRPDGHDEFGRQPLFLTSHKTRPSPSAIRSWMYQATFPCRFADCPHGYEPASCEFKTYSSASRCPSSRSPHAVRSGSLTWHRNRGYPRDVLKDRANASESTIEEYYDKPTKRQEFEHRRRDHIDKLHIDTDDTETHD